LKKSGFEAGLYYPLAVPDTEDIAFDRDFHSEGAGGLL
jgi:hypothetical protein